MLHTTTDDIIPSQTSEESDQQSSSYLSNVSTNIANSPTSLSLSQITSNDIEQPSNSQLSDSSAKQLMVFSLKKKNNYEALVKKASLCPDFKDDIFKIRSFISKSTQPEMDPKVFEKDAMMLVPKICKSP